MKRKQLYNKPELKSFRKDLRTNGTSAEAALWTLLKGRQVRGYKFRRQFSVGNYILDFYCPAARLCVELDGQGHFTPTGFEYDEERTAYLKNFGIRVIRFENKDVFEAQETVLEEIRRALERE